MRLVIAVPLLALMDVLEELADSVSRAPRMDGKVDLGLFVEQLSLEPPEDDDEGGDAVALMTLHSAKGLEFPVVFLVGMEEGLLPHGGGPTPAQIDEERRLCYVGMTRAQEKLYLWHARSRRRRGHASLSLPSRFLSEIPVELTDRADAPPGETGPEERLQARSFFQGVPA